TPGSPGPSGRASHVESRTWSRLRGTCGSIATRVWRSPGAGRTNRWRENSRRSSPPPTRRAPSSTGGGPSSRRDLDTADGGETQQELLRASLLGVNPHRQLRVEVE